MLFNELKRNTLQRPQFFGNRFTFVVEVVLGELCGSIDEVAEVGEELRVVLEHEVLPLEGGVLVLRPSVHQIKSATE